MVATVSGALLPAVAIAARLQRESATETEAAVIASTHLERLKAAIEAGGGAGGAIDSAVEGWSAFLTRGGATSDEGAAPFECRWQIAQGVPGVWIIRVRVLSRAGPEVDVSIAAVMPDV